MATGVKTSALPQVLAAGLAPGNDKVVLLSTVTGQTSIATIADLFAAWLANLPTSPAALTAGQPYLDGGTVCVAQ